MDDVSLKNRQTTEDQDLDNLIFNDKKEAAATSTTETSASEPTAHDSSDEGDHKDEGKKSGGGFTRSSLVNVLPVDKIKNGASTATKYVLTVPIDWRL